MHGLTAAALGLTLLAGCSDRPAPAAPDAAVVAAAPEAAAEATVEERQARFEARPVITLPAELPPAWGKLVRGLGARPIALRHEVRTTTGRADWRAITLDLRVFGQDAAVEAKLVEALRTLGLPGLGDGLPADTVEEGPVRWSIQVDRLVAPPGEAREQLVHLEWRRTPPSPDDPAPCRKPQPVEAPAVAPGWLAEVTSRRSTRQRITASSRVDAKARRVEMRMLFHNGFAHDEHVGHLTEAAGKAGYTRVDGEGVRQRWKHPDGATLAFHPDTVDDLGLGCTLAGPVIGIEWSAGQ